MAISDEDLQALMETTAGLKGPHLDLILHSPGGSIEAAEAIVFYLRSRFESIRVLVPNLAMSAASMIACAADEIVMGKHSFLGPTDPRVPVSTPFGWRLAAANDVLRQFDRARDASRNRDGFDAWIPMLNQYGPDLLERCDQSVKLSKELVHSWLRSHLLKGVPEKADALAETLNVGEAMGSHSRHISRQYLIDNGVKVLPLESDEILEDLLLSVFHATTHMMAATQVTKIVENHLGRAYIKFEGHPAAAPSI